MEARQPDFFDALPLSGLRIVEYCAVDREHGKLVALTLSQAPNGDALQRLYVDDVRGLTTPVDSSVA